MSHICSKIVIFLFKPILKTIFITIAKVKVETKTRLYTLAIVLMN